MKPAALFFILLVPVALSRGQQGEQTEKSSKETVWPKTSVWLLTLGGGEGSQLIVEAAELLATQDFSCTLVSVAAAANQPAKPTNALIKTVFVDAKEVAAQGATGAAAKDDTLLVQGEIDAQLAACEALLLESSLLAQLKAQPPKVVIFPGYLHDGCILPLLPKETAAVVLSTGSVSSAWLGHATNTVPFSAQRAPLQPSSTSLVDRAVATLRWKSFIQEYEHKYWKLATQKVANKTEQTPIELDEGYKSVAFLASGSHALLEMPVPSLSLKVSVGCFHCRHANVLPEELQEWVLPRRSGLIVVSLPPTKELLSALSILARELPQFGFLWIGQTKLPTLPDSELPSNIVHHDQVTEQDALGHPRARLVVSRCSEILVLGSMFHGIPSVCMPQTWEEKFVSERVIELGIGLEAKADLLKLGETIQTVIENQNKFRGAARHLGVIIRDEPETASDRLTFWVGHTARHWGHGHDDVLQEVRQLPRDIFGLFDVGFLFGLTVGVLTALLITALTVLALKQRGQITAETTAESGKKKGRKGE